MSNPNLADTTSERRREVALIALSVFLERGYAGTSMARVARVVGTTKSALYHHFATKEEMFVCALAADASGPLDALKVLMEDRPGDAATRWRAALGHAYDAVQVGSMGRLLMVLAQTGQDVPEVARGFHDEVIAPFRTRLRAIYSDATRAGTHRPLPAGDIDQIVFGPLLSNALTQSLLDGTPDLHAENLDDRNRQDFIDMVERLTAKDDEG
jgi:AcrR family transcriptional regulator